MSSPIPGCPRAPRQGLTLIELIIVLVILAAVAGLIIPAVSMIGRSSDMAVSAKTQADVANNIQQHFVLQKRYPQGMDSLLVDTGSGFIPYLPVVEQKAAPGTYEVVTGNGIAGVTAYSASTHDAEKQIDGLPLAGPDLWKSLAVGTLSSNQRRSLARGGLDWVFDHVQTTNPALLANANVSGINRRDLPASGGMNACVVDTATGSTGRSLLQQLVPRDFTTGHVSSYSAEPGTQVVAFGIGPKCSLLGTTSNSIPTYPGNDGKYYGRYIAYFKVYESGERATFLGVSDAYGRLPDYTQQQFNESLPNGGRKG